MILQGKHQNHAYFGMNAYQAHIKNETGIVRLITGKEEPVQSYFKFKFKISASADGGPRSRVCARLTLCSAPHRH